jgi:hypothetical protein
MIIEDQLISEIKLFINNNDLDGLKIQWNEWKLETEFNREIAWDYIFHKIYIHAALKKRHQICEWLDTLFTELNSIEQIAMRQMFSYAKYLLNKR